jgi:hypothetical protein
LSTYSRMLSSERGQSVQRKINEKAAREKEERERQILQTKTDAECMPANVEETILMKSVSETLPEIVERFTAHEEHKTAGTIIDRLCDSLLSERSEVRAQAAASLAGIIDRLPAEGQADLEEKICIALGKIGSPDAVPALTELSRAKGFLSARSYPEKVKHAANRALASIRGKQAER